MLITSVSMHALAILSWLLIQIGRFPSGGCSEPNSNEEAMKSIVCVFLLSPLYLDTKCRSNIVMSLGGIISAGQAR